MPSPILIALGLGVLVGVLVGVSQKWRIGLIAGVITSVGLWVLVLPDARMRAAHYDVKRTHIVKMTMDWFRKRDLDRYGVDMYRALGRREWKHASLGDKADSFRTLARALSKSTEISSTYLAPFMASLIQSYMWENSGLRLSDEPTPMWF